MKKYDYILIGSGPGAYQMSNLLAKTDQRVLVIEGGQFGGTCPNYGCEPKIFLEGAVRAALQANRLVGRGIKAPIQVNWQQLMEAKLTRFNPWPAETKKIIEKSHDVEAGYAKFLDDQTVEVNGHRYQAAKIVVATGQTPHRLDITGKKFLHNSTDVLSLEKLPARVTFIGAGYVALELATLVAAAGAEVTVIDHSDRPLRNFPKVAVKTAIEEMTARGIKFVYNAEVTAIEHVDTGYQLTTNQGEIMTDYVVDATGRQPNLARLNLDATGIQIDRGGIIVDGHLQTTVPGIYAIGDVVSRVQPKLTPVAEFEGEYLFNYLMGKTREAIHYPVIGTNVFTFPEVAMAGINPDQVVGKPEYTVKNYSLGNSSLYAGQNDQQAQLTLVFKDQQLVGASEVSDTAADDINNFLPVIGLQITGSQYRRAVMAIYPALADKVGNDLL